MLNKVYFTLLYLRLYFLSSTHFLRTTVCIYGEHNNILVRFWVIFVTYYTVITCDTLLKYSGLYFNNIYTFCFEYYSLKRLKQLGVMLEGYDDGI